MLELENNELHSVNDAESDDFEVIKNENNGDNDTLYCESSSVYESEFFNVNDSFEKSISFKTQSISDQINTFPQLGIIFTIFF